LHKLTTTLANEHATVVVEHLNVAGMVRNRRIARALADTGLAELRRMLAYKTTWYGSRLVVANSPSSCSTSPRVAGRRQTPVEPTRGPSLLGRWL
jgi:putative transposase